jgi:hypothetical protein
VTAKASFNFGFEMKEAGKREVGTKGEMELEV